MALSAESRLSSITSTRRPVAAGSCSASSSAVPHGRRQGQADGEGAALSGAGAGRPIDAVHLRQRARQGQADAESAFGSGGGARLGLHEQLEDGVQVFLRKAAAVVGDRQVHEGVGGVGTQLDAPAFGVYLAAFTSRFCSTWDSRVESPCTYTVVGLLDGERVPARRDDRPGDLDAARHHVPQAQQFLAQLDLARAIDPTSSRSSTSRVTCVSWRSITSRYSRSTGSRAPPAA